MHRKTFIGVLVASGLSVYLLFFVVHDRFTPASLPHSSFEIACLWIGFVLSLPSLPFVYAFDWLQRPWFPPIWLYAVEATVAAFFWSFLVERLLKIKTKRPNQSLEPTSVNKETRLTAGRCDESL
jgi:hypothetical protein